MIDNNHPLMINTIIKWVDDSENPVIERILHLDVQRDFVVTFDIRTKTTTGEKQKSTLPLVRSLSTLLEEIQSGMVCVLKNTEDPYAYLTQVNEQDIEERHRAHRNKAWSVIKPLVLNTDGTTRVEFFDASFRHAMIEEAIGKGASGDSVGSASEEGAQVRFSKVTVYEWCRKWWRGGMVPNSLLPYWHLCGPKQGNRKVTKKLGRPSNRSIVQGKVIGVNVEPWMQDLLIRGYRKFFNIQIQYPWKYAYLKTMSTFFSSGTRMLPNGVLEPILLPVDERPTPSQFKYYAEKTRDSEFAKELKRLLGTRKFNLTSRSILGDSTKLATGPMSCYQIDAWIGDIYLVSALNRAWIIGKPVIYVIKDVYSRLVVGFSVGLEGPSWEAAMLALVNVVEDKESFCLRYGIEISTDMWPKADLSHAILADRGEFEGYNASLLENAFGTRISNTPPYRGDLKAIIERDFLLVKNTTVQFVPGFTGHKPRERTQRDYRLDACLTISEIKAVLIRHFLYYNNVWLMKDYQLDPDAISAGVPPIPIHLWNWGIENRTGLRREPPSPERVRLALLPRKKATITERGLLFEKVHYNLHFQNDANGERAQNLLVKARVEGRRSITVAYDKSRPHLIYLISDDGNSLVPCPMLPIETSFINRDDLEFYDIEDYLMRREVKNSEHRAVEEQSLVSLFAQNEALFAEAKRQAEEAQRGLSNQEILSDITANRQREINVETLQRGKISNETGETHDRTQKGKKTNSKYVPPVQALNTLEALLDEEDETS